jgi:hypothetical protein
MRCPSGNERKRPPDTSGLDGTVDALLGMVPAMAITTGAIWSDADVTPRDLFEGGRRSIGTLADTPAARDHFQAP